MQLGAGYTTNQRESEVPLHPWLSSALCLAPLRVFSQAAAQGEAEDEEGAVALSTPRCPGCGSSRFLPLDFSHFHAERGLGLLCPFPGSAGSCRSWSCPRRPIWPCHPGRGWLVTQGGTLSGTLSGTRRWPQAGVGRGRIVLVAREFTPVSALVPFHGSSLGLGYFSSVSF